MIRARMENVRASVSVAVAALAYEWVSEHRYQLLGGTDACARPSGTGRG